ncbi:hypothetical protein [Roseibium aggregatum]|nr:hypothetical protein [Roseibium aggregatum]
MKLSSIGLLFLLVAAVMTQFIDRAAEPTRIAEADIYRSHGAY